MAVQWRALWKLIMLVQVNNASSVHKIFSKKLRLICNRVKKKNDKNIFIFPNQGVTNRGLVLIDMNEYLWFEWIVLNMVTCRNLNLLEILCELVHGFGCHGSYHIPKLCCFIWEHFLYLIVIYILMWDLILCLLWRSVLVVE